MYEKVTAAIREVDEDHIVFFQPAQFPDKLPIMGGIINEVGFEEIPKQGALNDHAYCCTMEPDLCKNPGEFPMEKLGECRDYHKRTVAQRKKDAKRLGVPLFFTEFGMCGDNESCFRDIRNTCDAFDEYAISWAFWSFKGFGDHATHAGDSRNQGLYNADGDLQEGKLRSLQRTYFQSYQGTPGYSKFDPDSGDIVAHFYYDSNVRNHSTIYLNKEDYYPNGYKTTAILILEKGMEMQDVYIRDLKHNSAMVLFPKAQGKRRHGELIFTLTPILEEKEGVFQSNEAIVKWSAEEYDILPHTLLTINGLEPGYVLGLLDGYDRVVKEFTGDEAKPKHLQEIRSGDMVGTRFVLHKLNFVSSILGLDYAEELITFSVPSLNGHALTLDIKTSNFDEQIEL